MFGCIVISRGGLESSSYLTFRCFLAVNPLYLFVRLPFL